MKTGVLAADECDNIQVIEEDLLSVRSKGEVVASAFTLTEVVEESEANTSDNCSSDCGKPPLPKTLKTETPLPPPPPLSTFKHPSDGDPDDEGPKYTWRINLSRTEPFWAGWFKGLSQKFLEVRVPKILLLANIHGLDTALTVGQMQGKYNFLITADMTHLFVSGKFQLQVLSKSGHAIHEDQPQHVSEIISGYLVKQRLANVKSGFTLPPMPCC